MKSCFRKSKPKSPDDRSSNYIEDRILCSLPLLEIAKMIDNYYTHPYKSAKQEIDQYYESFDETYHTKTAEHHEESERKRKEFVSDEVGGGW